MYIKFKNISEARTFSKYFYRLFIHTPSSTTTHLYDSFQGDKGFGWVVIPKGSLFMRHKRRTNFKSIFDKIKPIISTIFTTPISEVKTDMIDKRRLDVNQFMRDNCTTRTRAYLYKNGHLTKEDEPNT